MAWCELAASTPRSWLCCAQCTAHMHPFPHRPRLHGREPHLRLPARQDGLLPHAGGQRGRECAAQLPQLLAAVGLRSAGVMLCSCTSLCQCRPVAICRSISPLLQASSLPLASLPQVCRAGVGRPRKIWLTRHGESQFNTLGKIGGNSALRCVAWSTDCTPCFSACWLAQHAYGSPSATRCLRASARSARQLTRLSLPACPCTQPTWRDVCAAAARHPGITHPPHRRRKALPGGRCEHRLCQGRRLAGGGAAGVQGGWVGVACNASHAALHGMLWPAVMHLLTPHLLHAFLCPPAAVWTSTLQRTIITASGLHYPKVQWKALDEIQVGSGQDRGGTACLVAGGWSGRRELLGVDVWQPAGQLGLRGVGWLVLFVCSTRAPACAAPGQLQ